MGNRKKIGGIGMKIVIAGAGAMGSRFGVMLHQAGHEVLFVDGWESHVQAINEQGLQVNDNGEEKVFHIPAVLQSKVKEDTQADLIILFTKAMQLDQMLQDIQSLIHSDTKILCLLNGIGHEEIIEKYVAPTHILLGNTMWTAGMNGPGKVTLFGNGTVALKNLAPEGVEDAKEVVDVLNSGGLNATYSENILFAIYKKACVNGTMNGLCTILDSNMADFGETTTAHEIVEAIVTEFSSVAKYENVEINVKEIVDYIEMNCYNRDTIGLHHPSMHQDLILNNRLTEIDYINGAVVRKGKKYGVPTPYCAFLTSLIHCKEQILKAH